MFSFNSDKFDFWKIYESIKRFYPIGIRKDEGNMFFSYRGLKELEKIIVDNIHDTNNFNSRWKNFTKETESEIGKEIFGTTNGQAPSFSSFVLLDTASLDNLTRIKELHFFVSLVGPFYTIMGQDHNTVRIGERHYKSTNYLVVSPENEFAKSFIFLADKVKNRFKGYQFVPFEICRQTIEGLAVRYSDENLNTVFHALFNNHINLSTITIGNNYYKSEDWLKDGYLDTVERWTAYPPPSEKLHS